MSTQTEQELNEAAAVVNGLRGFAVGDMVTWHGDRTDHGFRTDPGVVIALIWVADKIGTETLQGYVDVPGLEVQFTGKDLYGQYRRNGPLREFRHAD